MLPVRARARRQPPLSPLLFVSLALWLCCVGVLVCWCGWLRRVPVRVYQVSLCVSILNGRACAYTHTQPHTHTHPLSRTHTLCHTHTHTLSRPQSQNPVDTHERALTQSLSPSAPASPPHTLPQIKTQGAMDGEICVQGGAGIVLLFCEACVCSVCVCVCVCVCLCAHVCISYVCTCMHMLCTNMHLHIA